MAPGAGALWLFLLCLPSVINAETNQAKRLPRASVNYVQYYHSKPPHVGGGHSYPGSQGHSGSGRRVTSAPYTTQHTHIQHTRAPEVHSYPQTGGGSGSGQKTPHLQVTPGTHSYPSSDGGSGSGHKTPHLQVTPGTHLYPSSDGGSGSGHKTPHLQVAPGTHSYPQSGGGSGSGQKLPHQLGISGTHSYPPSNGTSGSGHKQPVPTQGYGTGVYPHPTWHPGNIGHNNGHNYGRNQQTNIGVTNYHMTNVHNYHYRPPMVISYSSSGAQHSYPAYTGVLPQYVYEYRASRSRYRYLLTGLALYNFGLLSQNPESHRYHDSYILNLHKICKFGVLQYEGAYEEVDIDCRLITYFIWSGRHQPIVPDKMTTEVFKALDSKFYGKPLQIRPGMQCYIKWTDHYLDTRVKDVDCGLLQTYVDRSFSSAAKIKTTLLVAVTSFVVFLLG